MTVSEMIKVLQEIEAQGYGNAEVKRFDDDAHYSDYTEIDDIYMSHASDEVEVHVC